MSFLMFIDECNDNGNLIVDGMSTTFDKYVKTPPKRNYNKYKPASYKSINSTHIDSYPDFPDGVVTINEYDVPYERNVELNTFAVASRNGKKFRWIDHKNNKFVVYFSYIDTGEDDGDEVTELEITIKIIKTLT